ncbi:AAA family ATPase [Streptomyces echinatus]|uniref:AAA family ATPase n=1 Tax=Streptomyces echinatus TaxID=67293 RepID=UPI0037B9B100
MLIVMGGLPGTGKTTLARLPAAPIGAVHLRVDTVDQAIVRTGAPGTRLVPRATPSDRPWPKTICGRG